MFPPSIWRHPPTALQLGTHEVHVWHAYLPAHRPRLAALANLLTPDERLACERFHFAPDCERYILARGVLREILHRYLAVAPESLRFSYGRYGKVALAAPAERGWLRFNLTHSHNLTLYAVCRDQELGIDIEWVHADIEYEQIARRVFSPYEIKALFTLAPPDRIEAFFRCWTIKEAYVKGHGGGLSMPFDQFDTEFTLDVPAAVVETRPDATEAGRWTVARLDPGPGYTAALAVGGPIKSLSYWQVESTPPLGVLPV